MKVILDSIVLMSIIHKDNEEFMGKGSDRRPCNYAKYNAEFDRIFPKKEKKIVDDTVDVLEDTTKDSPLKKSYT